MASRKEHMRKQKSKARPARDEENPFLHPGLEINSLNLLSTPHAVHKAAEGVKLVEQDVPDVSRWQGEEQACGDAEEKETARLAEQEALRRAEEEERVRREAELAERSRREAEEKEAARLAEEEAHRRAEETERARREAELAERSRREAEEKEAARLAEEEARRCAEEEERVRREAELAERSRREAEEKEAARLAEEEARRRAEEEERVRREAELAERSRREAEEKEAARLAEEEARRRAEEEERVRREAELAERSRREAEEKEAARLAEEEARRCAEEEERVRREAELAERSRREAEEKEAARLAEEEARRRAEEEERARRMAEEKERARQLAMQVERARAEAEEVERRRREAAEADRAAQEAAAAERAKEMAATAEQARLMAEKAARARRNIEADGRAVPVMSDSFAHSAPPLEVENAFWQKPPEIFDVLSGAPHGVAPAGPPDYSAIAERGPSLPVTMVEPGQAPPGSYSLDLNEYDAGRVPAPGETVAVPLEKRMYIVMVTPEVAPCAKVGGLGDVVLGLGRELMKRGHGVEVICPMYSGMRYDLIEDLHEEYGELWCPHYNEWRPEKVFQGKVGGGLQVNFITGGAYTERPSIYGYDDDLQRFTYFSRQALEFMYKTNRRPDVIHCHDWATGLVPPILWGIYEKLGWNNSRVVYTIHNNECQGLCGFGDKLLGMVGLDVREYMRPDRMQDDSHKNCINMMKAGIVYSNFVTTVSPTYAGELKSVSGGRGLQTTIAKNSAKVGGVLNGIDYDSWNPATDDKLAARYSGGDDFFEKYKNKAALREWLGMWDAWRPIISVVTRLTHQKGLDLIKHAIYSCQKLQAQFVLLGSAPDPKVNNDFLALQHQLRDNHDINLYIGYHEDLSRLIYAGSDMFLIPSLYEPCGLTQMISLRYGTVPIVRETGGLVDTVFDLDNSGLGLNEANGFTFRDATPASLDYGLERAVRLWYDNPDAFNRLARNGMRYDYSWRNPTEHYENIYNYIKA